MIWWKYRDFPLLLSTHIPIFLISSVRISRVLTSLAINRLALTQAFQAKMSQVILPIKIFLLTLIF